MPRFRNLPLFWKLLIPSLALIVVAGSLGAVLIVRDLSARARATLNEDLLQASLRARAVLADRELYILESANFAANLRGMADSVRERDRDEAGRLLESALALKTDLTFLAATNANGVGLVEFTRAEPAGDLSRARGVDLSGVRFVSQTLDDVEGSKAAGILEVADEVLAIASPICSGTSPCAQVGVVVAGIGLERLAADVAAQQETGASELSVSLFDAQGGVLAARGPTPSPASVEFEEGQVLRHTETINGVEVATLTAPLRVQDRRIGEVAVTLPTAPALAAASGAGLRLAAVILAAMAGIIAIGGILSRSILRQVRPLVETNRALGRGDLAARAPVVADDELGELARGVNQMAEQLQASRDTLELQVAQRTEEIERLLAERTQFFASISHELRTPLAIILSQADRLQKKAASRRAPWAAEPADVIKGSGKEVLALVNDILELARAETGRLEINVEDVSLGEVLADVEPTLRGLTSAAELDLTLDVPTGLPPARADRRRLREILLNLVDNAVKYTPPGGSVAVGAAARGERVQLTVADTGIGIPETVGERIFEPFYRVPDAPTQRGEAATGIGLALARRLVEAQGGEINYTSDPDRGVTFTVTLFAAEESPPSTANGGRRARPSRDDGRRRSAPTRAS